MSTYGVAVIGLGVGQGHLKAYQQEPRTEVRAICDLNEELLHRVGDEFDIATRLTDFHDLAARDDIELVSICTPDHLHADPAVTLMEAGKHVFIEKPMATSTEDIRRIVETAEKTGRKVVHGCQLRFLPQYRELKRRVAAGDLGTIFYAEGDYISNHAKLFVEGWRGRLGAEYNALAGGGVHPIDILLWLIDDEPVTVTAFGNNISLAQMGGEGIDCAAALVKFKNGAVAKSLVSCVAIRPGFRNIAVYGTRGTFLSNPSGGPTIALAEQGAKWQPFESEASSADARADLIKNWINSIEEDRLPVSNVYEGAKVAAVCVAGFQSIKSGQPEPVIV